MWSTVKSWVPVISSFILIVGVAVFGYLVFLDGTAYNQPIIYWEGSFAICGDHYHPGDTVWARMYATKNTPKVGRVTWTLINNQTGKTEPYGTRPGSVMLGYNETTYPLAVLSKAVVCGEEYHFSGTSEYDVNGFRTVAYHLRTTDFMVECNGKKEN